MKFKISSATFTLWSERLKKLEAGYPCLHNFGFEIVDDYAYVTVNTLEQLTDLIKQVGNKVIIYLEEMWIVIYDDYWE